MCDSCCLDPIALAELSAEEAREAERSAEAPAQNIRVVDHESAGIEIDEARPVWVSAGATSSVTLDDRDARPLPAPDVLLRDALAQLGRVFFDRQNPVPVILEWHPAISPMLLDAAGRFADGRGPLVWNVSVPGITQSMRKVVQALEWRRGVLVKSDSNPTMPARTLIVRRALRAAIFLGGDDRTVGADAAALGGSVPAYAVGSTGGTANTLLAAGATYGARHPTLGQRLAVAGSYLQLFNDVLASLP